MTVSVIIVNYNGKHFIGECLDSVLESIYRDFEIIVIDNASIDGSFDYLKKEYGKNSKVRIVRSLKQLYFTGGSNLGARRANGDFLFFLNSDTIVDKHCLKNLINFVDGNTFLVQPKILSYDKQTILDNVGGRYNFFGFGFAIGRGESDYGQYDRNQQVDYVNGTAFMIRKDLFWKSGGFDERYRYFYEDVDLCLRAKRLKGECWYCYQSIIYHKGSLTFRQNLNQKKIAFYIRRNRLLTLYKSQKNLGLLIKLPIHFLINLFLSLKEPFFQNQIIKSGSLVFLGNNLVNLLNFAFTIVMARLLGPQGYGEMIAIFTLLIFLGIPSGIITSTIAKYTAEYQAKKNFYLVKKIDFIASRWGFWMGILLSVIFFSLIPFFSQFFHLKSLPFLIFAFVFPLSLLSDAKLGVLQGLQQFLPFSLTPLIATVLKFIFAVLLVFLGFSLPGIIFAFVLGIFFAYLYANFKVNISLKNQVLLYKAKTINLSLVKKDILTFAKTVSVTTLLLALFGNIDIILVKHYLDPFLAGQYASLATLGRIILYVGSPFITVMFSLVSSAYVKNQGKEKQLLKNTLSLVLIISLFTLLVFAFFPHFIVKLLFGQEYLAISPYLIWFGLLMLFNTLSRSFISFFLAVNEKGFLYPLTLSTALLVILIFTFHQTIALIILAVLIANFILFLGCLGVYLKTNHAQQ